MSSAHNLVAPLACMATGITFLLGFTPVAKVPLRFFTLHSLIAGILWIFVFAENQGAIFFILTAACAMAWQNFRTGKAQPGKMFLAAASGASVGFGLFRTGIIPPPFSIPLSWSSFWIVSVLLGSALLGACYLVLMMGHSFTKKQSVPADIFERSLRIFLGILALRTVLFVGVAIAIWLGSDSSGLKEQWFTYSHLGPMVASRLLMGLLAPIGIAFWGLRQLKNSSIPFVLAPFYVVIFLVLWGEMSALKLGF